MRNIEHPLLLFLFAVTSIALIIFIYSFAFQIYKKHRLNKEVINACYLKNFNQILFWIHQGADLNLIVNEFGDSILHVLAQNNQADLYVTLVRLGANPNTKNSYNHTAQYIYEYTQLKINSDTSTPRGLI